jgi:hypothetical protein
MIRGETSEPGPFLWLVDPDSLADLKTRFDWSTLYVYGLNAPGENHGVLLGSKGWRPSHEAARA